MKYDNVIFDFDGTVSDTSEGVIASLNYAFARLGVEVCADFDYSRFIGPALMDSFQRFVGMTHEQAKLATAAYREVYTPKNVYLCSLYDGIVDVFELLRKNGIRLSIASAKPENQLKKAVDALGISQYFDAVCGQTDDKIEYNDKSDVIRRAICGTAPVMVGDSIHDVAAARRVGVPVVGVTYGFTSFENMTAAEPDYIAASPLEIAKIALND